MLPLPVAAAPMAATPVHTTQVGWAALFARANNHATPALMQKWLNVGPQQAHALMSELTRRNIIQVTSSGAATAVQPMYQTSGIPGVAQTTSNMVEAARDVWDAVMEEEIDTDDPEAPDATA